MIFFKTYQTFSQIFPELIEERKIMYKQKTVTDDICRATRFNDFLIENGLDKKPLKNITNKDISKFSIQIAKQLDQPTCKKYITTLSMVWRHAKKTQQYPDIELPFNMVVYPAKKGDFSPELIPKEIFEDLTNDMKKRDYSLYIAAMIIYYAFIRPRRELLNITTENYNFDNRLITVPVLFAKTKVVRSPIMTEDLNNILLSYELDKAPKGKYLFHRKVKYSDSPLGENTLSYRFDYFKEKFHLPDKVVLYSFKHTGITDMLNAGVPLITVMQQAGHMRLSSTQHYAKKYSGLLSKELLNYSRVN